MKTLISNIGLIVSGDIAKPLLDGDSIVVVDGTIAAVGKGLDGDADTVIDVKGSTVIPGLIDSHCHPVFGDFTPRQRTVDFIESGLNGGLTTMISAGEVHLPRISARPVSRFTAVRRSSSSVWSRRTSPKWPSTGSS